MIGGYIQSCLYVIFKLKSKKSLKKIDICKFFKIKKFPKIELFSTLEVPGEKKLDLHKL